MKYVETVKGKRVNWIMIFITIAFCFLTMLYSDNIINSSSGYRYISSIFSGTFREFYNDFSWSYGFTVYTIYAIWSIPVWIVNHIRGTENLVSIPILIWYKLLLALFAVWSVYIVGKISEYVCRDEKKEIQLQYISSAFFIFPIFAIAQCDIIGLCFALLGVMAYIKEDEKKFIIYFAIALTMKYFAAFVFVPLVLYRYKRLYKIMGALVSGFSLMVISMIMFKGDIDSGNIEDVYVQNQIFSLNDISIQIGEVTIIGLLGFFFLVVCLLAYVAPRYGNDNRIQYTIWLAFTGYMCFFLFYNCNMYWYVLLAPFWVLLTYSDSNPKKRLIGLILEIIYSTTVLLKFLNTQSWVFMGNKAYSYLMLKTYGVAPSKNLILTVLSAFFPKWSKFLPIIQGITYASAVMMIILYFPSFKIVLDNNDDTEYEKDVNIVSNIRIFVVYMWIIISLLGMVKEQKTYWFNDVARIENTEEGIYNSLCQYTGDLYDDGTGGLWMGDELDIQIHLKSSFDSDIELTTYGYSVSADAEIMVYVNNEYVGNLQREDETLNATNRMITIPKGLLEEKGDVTISLKTIPTKTVTDDEDNEVSLGLYFENIYIRKIDFG